MNEALDDHIVCMNLSPMCGNDMGCQRAKESSCLNAFKSRMDIKTNHELCHYGQEIRERMVKKIIKPSYYTKSHDLVLKGILGNGELYGKSPQELGIPKKYIDSRFRQQKSDPFNHGAVNFNNASAIIDNVNNACNHVIDEISNSDPTTATLKSNADNITTLALIFNK